jgi:branched-chain amino acid transport system permease protein
MMQRKALYVLLLLLLIAVPFIGIYPLFVMKVLCFALFAAAFNLLIGYTGLLSFGHAMFLGMAPSRPSAIHRSWACWRARLRRPSSGW